MTLMGILALSFIPQDSLQRFNLETATARVEQDLRYARELATTTGANCGINFIANGSYTVYSPSIASPVLNPLTKQAFIEDIGLAYKNVNVANSIQVEFSPLGRPVLGSGQTVQLTDGQTTASLLVTPNTGIVIRQ